MPAPKPTHPIPTPPNLDAKYLYVTNLTQRNPFVNAINEISIPKAALSRSFTLASLCKTVVAVKCANTPTGAAQLANENRDLK